MLSESDSAAVSASIARWISDVGDVRQVVRMTFLINPQEILLELPVAAALPADNAASLLAAVFRRGWPANPGQASLLEIMLEALIQTRAELALQPIRLAVQQRVDPYAAHFQSRWLLAGQPFFDRALIRNSLQTVLATVDTPILLVNGPRFSGKSYTGEFISYLAAQDMPNLNFVMVRVKTDNSASYTLEDLALELTALVSTETPLQAGNGSSRARIACNWIVRNLARQQGTWVLVLDGLGDPNLPSDVRQLVECLSDTVLLPQFVKRMRLILLDYAPLLPGNGARRSLEEVLPAPTAVDVPDIEDCLHARNAWIAAGGTNAKPIDPAAIPQLAGALIAQCPTEPEKRLSFLCSKLGRLT